MSWSSGTPACDPKMQQELKACSSLCSGSAQIVQDEVLIFPNFPPATANFSSAAVSGVVLQQLEVKMIFLAKNSFKKNPKKE